MRKACSKLPPLQPGSWDGKSWGTAELLTQALSEKSMCVAVKPGGACYQVNLTDTVLVEDPECSWTGARLRVTQAGLEPESYPGRKNMFQSTGQIAGRLSQPEAGHSPRPPVLPSPLCLVILFYSHPHPFNKGFEVA